MAILYDFAPHTEVLNLAATVDWGDGTTSAGELVAVAWGSYGQPIEWDVLASHDYTEAGAYLVTTTITACGDPLATAYCTGLVDDVPLSGTPAVVPDTGATANAVFGLHDVGLSSVALATFTESSHQDGITDFTAVIDWGDTVQPSSTGDTLPSNGLGSGTATAAATRASTPRPAQIAFIDGLFTVLGSHAYAQPGAYMAQVFVQDCGGAFLCIDVPITVTPASEGIPAAVDPLTLFNGNPYEQIKHEPTSATATTRSSAVEYGWSIKPPWQDWTGWDLWTVWWQGQDHGWTDSITTFPVVHAFAEEGSPALGAASSWFVDDTSALTHTVATADAGLWTIGARPTLAAMSGQEISSGTTLLTFADDNPAEVNLPTAEIDWGDGTFDYGTVVREPDNTYMVETAGMFGHIYATAGKYTVLVTISDDESSTCATVEIDVSAGVNSFTPQPFGAVAELPTGQLMLATFFQADDNAGGDYGYDLDLPNTYVIDWGDGTTTTGMVVPGASLTNTFAVVGAHTYQGRGVYLVTITLTDAGGGVSRLLRQRQRVLLGHAGAADQQRSADRSNARRRRGTVLAQHRRIANQPAARLRPESGHGGRFGPPAYL